MKNTHVIYGIRPVQEAIDAGREFNKILVKRGLSGSSAGLLLQSARKHNIYIQHVPVEKLNAVTRSNHQGVIAFISPVQYFAKEAVIPGIFESGKTPLLMLLDGVTDVRNFGAIARSAECAGLDGVIILRSGGALVTDDAVKTSAGALLHLPVIREDNLRETLRFIKHSGLQIIAATEKATASYHSVDYQIPTLMVVGSEERGLSSEVLKEADKLVRIPVLGKTSSLNVSVSAGILMYEAVRQRTDEQ